MLCGGQSHRGDGGLAGAHQELAFDRWNYEDLDVRPISNTAVRSRSAHPSLGGSSNKLY